MMKMKMKKMKKMMIKRSALVAKNRAYEIPGGIFVNK